jgi:hypothetical protein
VQLWLAQQPGLQDVQIAKGSVGVAGLGFVQGIEGGVSVVEVSKNGVSAI